MDKKSSKSEVIYSYGSVFRIERRIYRFWGKRLPMPYGVPLRGIGYAVGGLICIVISQQLPGVGWFVSQIPAPLRFVILPFCVGLLAVQVTPDGRDVHRFASSWLRHHLTPRQSRAGRYGRFNSRHLRMKGVCTMASPFQGASPGPGVLSGRSVVRVRGNARLSVGDAVIGPGQLLIVRAGEKVRF